MSAEVHRGAAAANHVATTPSVARAAIAAIAGSGGGVEAQPLVNVRVGCGDAVGVRHQRGEVVDVIIVGGASEVVVVRSGTLDGGGGAAES